MGHCPDIEMWHLYPGDIANTRSFTEDFIKGEMTYLARGSTTRREVFIEAPIEWSAPIGRLRHRDDRRTIAGGAEAAELSNYLFS